MTSEYVARSSLEEIERVVLLTLGVVSLHPGMWGEAGTYLPGGIFTGLRVDHERIRVHITVDMSRPVSATAADVRARLISQFGGTVDVVVEDVVYR